MQKLLFFCLLLFVIDIDGNSDLLSNSRQLTASKHTPKPKQKKHTPKKKKHTPKPRKHTPKKKKHTPKPRKRTPKKRRTPPLPPCTPGFYKGTCCDRKCKCYGATCNAIASEAICNYNVQKNVCTAAAVSAGGFCTSILYEQTSSAVTAIYTEYGKAVQASYKHGCNTNLIPDPTNAAYYCEKEGQCER